MASEHATTPEPFRFVAEDALEARDFLEGVYGAPPSETLSRRHT